jgi:hypothetical protein
MAEEKATLAPARRKPPPFGYRAVDLMLDSFLARIRVVLFPFRMLICLVVGLDRGGCVDAEQRLHQAHVWMGE